MSEPTRPIRQPTPDTDGSLVAHTVATPKSFKVRAKVTVGSRKVIPVIFVPGIMGSNLRVRLDTGTGSAPMAAKAMSEPGQSAGAHRAAPARQTDDQSNVVPGEPVWRPPNGSIDGLKEAWKWERRNPALRQRLLDPDLLEVDGNGDVGDEVAGLSCEEMRARGWGEIHLDSYGDVLEKLQAHLDTTFRLNRLGQREIRVHWKRVMQCDPKIWGVRNIEKITEAELERYAGFQYPVYAVGYNWLQSCAVSAERLSRRIDEIKEYWRSRKHDCTRVILVTHSMGGLVARACARMRAKNPGDPADIAGVIHGVMPALGAPVAYRRIACGTEGGRYTNGLVDNIKADRFVEIAGTTPEETTAVMATAPGVLELLPNHLYPTPWLLVKTLTRVNNEEKEQQHLGLPAGNPYDLYRDMKSWYRLINPNFVDPAGKFARVSGGAQAVVIESIDKAEHLHRNILSISASGKDNPGGVPYFHPNTYAFYGTDEERRAFGTIRWAARIPVGQGMVVTSANIRDGICVSYEGDGGRAVSLEGRAKLSFKVWGQNAPGDDTVPHQSASGVAGHVRGVFAARGFSHQECFKDDAMLLLTRHLIVKIIQGIK